MKRRRVQLSDILAIAIEAGGMTAAHALTRKLGGRRISVPRNPRANHPLTLAVGTKVAEAIAAIYTGMIEFPKGRALLRRQIAEEVEARNGTLNELAQLADVSFARARQLRKLVKKGKALTPAQGRRACDPRQIDIEDFFAR